MSTATDKLSPWHDAGSAPVHIGVYQVDDNDGVFPDDDWYAFFDGVKFCWRDLSPHEAAACRDNHTTCPERTKWRGVLK